MKQTKFLFLLTVLLSMVGIKSLAYDARVNGIYYNFSGEGAATVVYCSLFESENKTAYTGAINIPQSFIYNGKTYSVTSIGEYAFYHCSDLSSVTIPNSVTSIGEAAFSDCSGLTSISIPNSVTSIGNSAFSGCTGLTSVIIPNFVTTIGGYTFENCSGLTSVTIPNSVTNVGNGAFYGCSGLTSISIPNSVTSIGVGAFSGCSSLTSIVVESGNTKYDSRDNCNAIIEKASNTLIAGCKNTIIPNSITSIGSRAFIGCSGLTSVTIPNSVTSIGEYAFHRCSGLISIICYATNPPKLSSDFEDYTIRLYVPKASVIKYKVAEKWRNFVIIREIGEDKIYLSLKQPTGSMDIVVEEGERQTVRIVPESGYTIHSVTYNGTDVTSQLSDDNVFVTPEIMDNAVLYVTYENGDNPPIDQAKYLSIKHSENGTVKQKITLGRSYTYKITPVNGQKLSALYFNGVDITSEIKGNKFTTPVLNDNATLEVEFKAK